MLTPKGIITEATTDVYTMLMIIAGVVIAFLLFILVSKNLANMAWNFNIGLFLKIGKKYRAGDILRFGTEEWYIDVMNTYRIIFKRVIKWDSKEITLSKDEMIIGYVEILKSRIVRVGHFGH
jgi:hypothetical protein